MMRHVLLTPIEHHFRLPRRRLRLAACHHLHALHYCCFPYHLLPLLLVVFPSVHPFAAVGLSTADRRGSNGKRPDRPSCPPRRICRTTRADNVAPPPQDP